MRLPLLLLCFASAAAAAPDPDGPQRADLLRQLGERWPSSPPRVVYKEALPKSLDAYGSAEDGVIKVKPALVAAGALDRTPYNGDWMPATGSNFNVRPFHDEVIDLLGDPVLASHRAWLAEPWRSTLDAYSRHRLNAAETPKALPIIDKLEALDQRLKAKGEPGFDFRELTSPTADFPAKGSLREQYFAAREPKPLNLHIFYEPAAVGWWGQCHRLGLGNLSAAGDRLRKSFGGGFCGKTVVSRFDLEDMISFVHPLGDEAPSAGANRGNITEELALSPELTVVEESLGERPLAPATLATMLADNVRAGGSGILIDVASDPRDAEYGNDSIWNRPVFDFVHLRQDLEFAAKDAPVLFVARYGDELLRAAGDEPGAKSLAAARDAFRAAGKKANDAFGDLLTSEYYRRVEALGFTKYGPVPAHPPVAAAKKAYDDATKAFGAATDALLKTIAAANKTLAKATPVTVAVEAHRLEVKYPGQRLKWLATASPLFDRAYHYLVPVIAGKKLPASWDVFAADYPPDLVRLPPKAEPKNQERLASAIAGCVSNAAIAGVVQLVDAGGDDQAAFDKVLAQGGDACALPYLDADAILARFKGMADKSAAKAAWAAAAAKCE